jgi:hypothetical protein
MVFVREAPRAHCATPRPPHPASTFVTTAKRPSSETRRRNIAQFLKKRNRILAEEAIAAISLMMKS